MKTRLSSFSFFLLVTCFSYGQITVEDLKIDTGITGFHFAANFQGTYVYTPNGKSDLKTINPSAFSFSIMPNTTMQIAKKEVENLITMSKQNGYALTEVIRKDTTIGGYQSLIISYTETGKDTEYKNMVYNAIIMKENTAIVFVSGDLDKGRYLDNFKKTLYALKL